MVDSGEKMNNMAHSLWSTGGNHATHCFIDDLFNSVQRLRIW
jgi:hypothetical protein